ncbi:MAG: CBS domain-containing protein [Gammaproteobacteria bacterium]
MQAKEVMTGNVKMIPSSTTLQSAAELMREMNIGMLPIAENGKLVGTLTDRDIAVRAVASGADPKATPAGDCMSREVISCYEDQDARDVARVMSDNKVRRVVVVNRLNEAVGLVSVDDLAVHPETRALAEDVVAQFSKHH